MLGDEYDDGDIEKFKETKLDLYHLVICSDKEGLDEPFFKNSLNNSEGLAEDVPAHI